MNVQLGLRAILAISIGVAGATAAFAQPAGSRFEIGAQAAVLRLSDPGVTHAGLGGRLSFDVSNWVAAEAEFNFFPNDNIDLVSSAVTLPDFRIAHRRRRAEAFFGVKLGLRAERFGVFAKVRPGFAHLTHREMECAGACATVLMLLAQPVYRTEFAMDLGGILEFYPSARTVARFELGDTLIRHRSAAPPCWAATCTTHNIASGFGVGFRF